jgi:hypothetical protein
MMSSISGDFDTGGDLQDTPSSLPRVPSWEALFLVGNGAEKSTSSVTPLTGRLTITRCTPRLSLADLPAAIYRLFARGGGKFNHRT